MYGFEALKTYYYTSEQIVHKSMYHNYFNLDKFLNYSLETSFKYCFTKKF